VDKRLCIAVWVCGSSRAAFYLDNFCGQLSSEPAKANADERVTLEIDIHLRRAERGSQFDLVGSRGQFYLFGFAIVHGEANAAVNDNLDRWICHIYLAGSVKSQSIGLRGRGRITLDPGTAFGTEYAFIRKLRTAFETEH